MFINQMRSWENLKVDELVKLSRLFQSDTLKNLNTRPMGVGAHELRLDKTYFKTITTLFTMNRIILSKHRFKDNLKGQISVTRRFLSYFTSKVGVSSNFFVSILSWKKYIGSSLVYIILCLDGRSGKKSCTYNIFISEGSSIS